MVRSVCANTSGVESHSSISCIYFSRHRRLSPPPRRSDRGRPHCRPRLECPPSQPQPKRSRCRLTAGPRATRSRCRCASLRERVKSERTVWWRRVQHIHTYRPYTHSIYKWLTEHISLFFQQGTMARAIHTFGGLAYVLYALCCPWLYAIGL